MMREIEQFYSTQIEEMPMNVAGKFYIFHPKIIYANAICRPHLSSYSCVPITVSPSPARYPSGAVGIDAVVI